jgi:hypothetical protein
MYFETVVLNDSTELLITVLNGRLFHGLYKIYMSVVEVVFCVMIFDT